jgi:hypothetical protein
MTDISTMAGDAWREEPEFVRHYYKRIANEVKKLHDNIVRGMMASQSLEILEESTKKSNNKGTTIPNITPNLTQTQTQNQTCQNFDEIPQHITTSASSTSGYDLLNLTGENNYSRGYNNVLLPINGLNFELVSPESNNCYDLNGYFL